MEQVKTKSVEPHTRFALPEVNWDELNEPGAYVERGSGDLTAYLRRQSFPEALQSFIKRAQDHRDSCK
jgi:hypothetical protein